MTIGGPAAPPTEDPLLGKVLSERYRILKRLGEGGMGVVYLAEHVVIEKKIALKVLFPDLTRRSDLVQRFLQEAKSASRIGHQNVIDITDFGQSPEGYVFIAMEYLAGQDLGNLLKTTGPMAWGRAQPMVVQMGKALRAAHEKGIIHRDMKPENVFVIPREDGGEAIKVLDFGIAKVMGLDEDAPRLTRTGMIFGTPEYMSPEQAQGQSVDHRVDIYAVGCIMYHMLTGDVPFRAESFMGILSKHMLEVPKPPSTLNPQVSPEVEAVILRAMAKDPGERFQTMREFVAALLPLGVPGMAAADVSGAFSALTGQPMRRTQLGPGGGNSSLPSLPVPAPGQTPMMGVPTDGGQVSGPVVTSAPTTSPSTGSGPTGRRDVTPATVPHATHELPGRSQVPLAQANPEARRSRTEVFSRDHEDAPPPRKRSSNVGLIVVAVAAVLLVGGLLLVFARGSGSSQAGSAPGEPGAAPSPSAEAPGTASAPAGTPNGAPPGGASAAGSVEKGGAGEAPAATAPSKGEGTPADEGASRPAGPAANVAGGGKRRAHRSSREAVEALMPKGDEGTEAPSDTTPKRTNELKNPFASPTP